MDRCMNRRFLLAFSLLVFLGGLLFTLNGCAGFSSGMTSDPSRTLLGKFQHVVIIFQENRTPDNLFHDTVLIARGADIASSGVNSAGESIPLAPTPLGINYDLSHAHAAFVSMYDRGKMDGADQIPIACYVPANCPPPNAQFMYVQASDVQPYFQLAEQYVFGDRMFQTNQGPSFPAHQFILSGTSAPTATSNLFAAENPVMGAAAAPAGCAAPPSATVQLIDPSGNESATMYPCFEHPTLADELDARGLPWRYYAFSSGSIWTAPNAIQHLCGPNATPPNATSCQGADWLNNVILYTTQNPAPILTDIANSQLAAVSWVIPSGQNSDHAGSSGNTGGPSWVASIVNAIGNSAYWSNTAIIVTWDDWGGWYDHVPPPEAVHNPRVWGSGYVYGFRVPLIVIAPYAKPGYISHINHDFGSILNFVEQNFGLASLGYADAHADNLADCFNFSQTPLQFQTIQAPLDAKHFLNDHTPPTDPDDE
jgi:phospholipase C